MIDRRGVMRTLAAVAVFVLLATACGAGADDTIDDAAVAAEQTPASDDVGLAVPTTPPIIESQDVTIDTPEAEPAPLTEENFLEPANPNENIVLHVRDDVQIVPAFDAPRGNNIRIYDINAIDGIELEYPLYAQTVFGNRLALRVSEYDASGNWAKVQVPVRPNGTEVWVQTAYFTEERHDYNIVIDLSENMVNVYKGEELLLEQLSVAGRESRPTPIVRSYIDEKIPGGPLGSAYGSWVLSIAAFSESLGTFGGGMPKLALHGTNQPDLMGEYVSSGCVRVPNEVIEFIAETVPVGATVDIVA